MLCFLLFRLGLFHLVFAMMPMMLFLLAILVVIGIAITITVAVSIAVTIAITLTVAGAIAITIPTISLMLLEFDAVQDNHHVRELVVILEFLQVRQHSLVH